MSFKKVAFNKKKTENVQSSKRKGMEPNKKPKYKKKWN